MTIQRKSPVTQNTYTLHENVATLLGIAFLQSDVLEECSCGLCPRMATQPLLDALYESLGKELEPLDKWLEETDRERISTHIFLSQAQMHEDADCLQALVRLDATHPMLPVRWAHVHMWFELEVWGGIDQLDDNQQPARAAVPSITPEIEHILTRIMEYVNYWTGYIGPEPGWVLNLELESVNTALPPALH